VETQNLLAIKLMFIKENLLIKVQNKKKEKFLTTQLLNMLKHLEYEDLINKINI